MPEQLTLRELDWDRCAVDDRFRRDLSFHGRNCAGLNGVGEKFFAGAGLAQDQDVLVGNGLFKLKGPIEGVAKADTPGVGSQAVSRGGHTSKVANLSVKAIDRIE